MLCIKCGQEYEGQSCPRCEGPTILVNSEDYLRRKAMYENSLKNNQRANVRSSSEGSGDGSEVAIEADAVGEELRPDEVFKRVIADARRQREDKDEETVSVHNYGAIAAGIIAVIVCVALAVTAYRFFANRVEYSLYVRSGDIVYESAKDELKELAKADRVFFKADGRDFYLSDIHEAVKGSSVIQRMASKEGRSFAAVTYEEVDNIYRLYVWNAAGCELVAEGSDYIRLYMLGDDGAGIYSASVLLNDEGARGEAYLYRWDIAAGGISTQLISEDVRECYVYIELPNIMYLTNNKELHIYDYNSYSSRLVSYEVSCVYPESDRLEGYYSHRSEDSILTGDTLLYESEGQLYRYDMKLKENATAGISYDSGSSMCEYIYMSSGDVYIVDSGALYYRAARENKPEFSKIMDISSDDSVVIYADVIAVLGKDNVLYSVRGSEASFLCDNVTRGSVGAVINSTSAITYAKKGVFYYRRTLEGEELILGEVYKGDKENNCLYFAKKLYMYSSEGKLIYHSVVGDRVGIVGDADRFWLARKLVN